MRIATWNIERLRHKRELAAIFEACNQAKADILVLTETDMRVKPDYPFAYHTPLLTELRPDYYKPTENRVSIYTRYPLICQHQTYDAYTALCVELETERGPLLVYGTIMGIYGNRHDNFKQDLPKQIRDFMRLSAGGKNLCIAGDYNLSISDNYYYTTEGRKLVLDCFNQIGVKILTADRVWCIDHIALSESFGFGAAPLIQEWNEDKRLSDHKGIVVDL